ncbi:MAG: O-antigen ligase family protein [Balneolales bacterium]
MQKIGLQPAMAAVFGSMLIAMYFVPQMMLVICAILAMHALRGVKESIEALTFSFLIGFLNPGMFDFPSGALALRWLILISAFGRVLFTVMFAERYTIPKPIGSLLYFAMVCIALSVAASFHPMISMVKIIMFTVGAFTILMGFQLTADYKEYWERWFVNFYFFVMLVSLPFILTEVGYYNNMAGFQGILNQPQAYGLFLAPFTAYYTARIILQEDASLVSVLGMLLGWISIFFSQARMAFVAVTLSVVFLLIIRMMRGIPQTTRQGSFITYPVIVAACMAGIILVFNIDPVLEKFGSFVNKGYDFDTYEEGYQQSRGYMVDRSLNNFTDNPVMGIGFGIDSRLDDRTVGQAEFMGIPLGAPTEKGFLLSAVLEEIGLVGMAFFVFFFAGLISYVFRLPLTSEHALFLGCIFVNIAEMVFFSFGGSGLYLWLLIGFTSVGWNRE